ncbi:hypothetical protein MMC20_000041 [Loxospora ochrophaea]|nr:hypothetical protein [Loxospora ochrophaea]
MHTMQDSSSSSSPSSSTSSSTTHDPAFSGNGYLDGPSPFSSSHSRDALHRHQQERKSPKLVFAAVAGMLLPLVTQVGHAH